MKEEKQPTQKNGGDFSAARGNEGGFRTEPCRMAGVWAHREGRGAPRWWGWLQLSQGQKGFQSVTGGWREHWGTNLKQELHCERSGMFTGCSL